MRRTIAIAIGTLAIGAAVAATAAEPAYGVCRTQIVDDVAARFGHEVTRIEFDFNHEDGPIIGRSPFAGSANQAVVYTDGCDGYFVFDLFGTYFDCEHRAHYGTPPNYVRLRTAGEGCADLASR